MIQQLIDRVKLLKARVRRGNAVNVNDREAKTAAIDLATSYFESFRPSLVQALGEADLLNDHDNHWHELIKLAHGNNSRQSYSNLLGTLAGELKQLSVESLSRTTGRSAGGRGLSTLTPAEQQIIQTLEALLPSAAASYRQGILDLSDRDRLSYRGTASELREALRETLDQLAPDDEVVNITGFKYEEGLKKPTMKQKVRYVMTSRERSSGERDATERAVGGVEEVAAGIARATYNRASLAAHVETTRKEVLRVKRYVDTVLFDLLEISES